MTWWCSAQGGAWSWAWQAYPGVWLMVLLVGGSYAWALTRLQPPRFAGDDRPTRPREIWAFAAGLLLLWIAADWPVGALAAGYLLSVKTAQLLVFLLIAPPLMLLGLPRWLLRRALRGRVAFRVARFMTRPLIPLILYNVVLAAVHLPPVVDGLGTTQLGSFAVDITILATGFAFWWPALGRLPELQPMSYPGRIGYLMLGIFLPTVPASFFTFADYPIYSLYELAPRVGGLRAVSDQQIAGLLMKLGGGFILFGTMSVMFFRWHAAEETSDVPLKETVP